MSLRVYPFTLTETNTASEHVYASELLERLAARGVGVVDDPGEADVAHLFEVNAYSRAALAAFRYPTLLWLLASRTPVVVSTDDLYFTGDPSLTVRPSLYPLNHHTQRLLFRGCGAVVAISESVRENLSPHVAAEKLRVVRHGVDDAYRVEDVRRPGEPFVLHVSLAAPRKNPEAVRELARRLDSRFVIAGSGWEEHIPATPAYDNVELAGYLPEPDLVDLYKRASVFYFPTRHEGFGLPVLEAMAAGTAVVTTDVYAVPEVTGDAALLFAPDDVDAHLDAVTDLLADDHRRYELAERGRLRAGTFTWERAADGILAVYRDVV